MICIRTTRPKYLVFANDASQPICVAQFGGKDELERLHTILGRLHGKLPNLIAEPLALALWRDNIYIHLQTGLPGTPWFRIVDRYRSRESWNQLSALAYEVLGQLHRAISSFPDWVCLIHLGDELRLQAKLCMEGGVSLSNSTQDWIERCAESLDGMGELSCFWQHGDFCLNNLLVSPSRIAIIDFDEFGHTVMPLHDRISLGLSLHERAPLGTWSAPLMEGSNTSPKLECEESLVVEEQRLQGLYMHYLLWRINQCQGWPTRARVKAVLVAQVEDAAASGMTLSAGKALAGWLARDFGE